MYQIQDGKLLLLLLVQRISHHMERSTQKHKVKPLVLPNAEQRRNRIKVSLSLYVNRVVTHTGPRQKQAISWDAATRRSLSSTTSVRYRTRQFGKATTGTSTPCQPKWERRTMTSEVAKTSKSWYRTTKIKLTLSRAYLMIKSSQLKHFTAKIRLANSHPTL